MKLTKFSNWQGVLDGMYYVKDMDVFQEVSALLIDAHKKLLSMKTPSGFPELKGQDLQTIQNSEGIVKATNF